MFKKHSIKEQSIKQALSEIDDLRGYVEACGRDIAAFKREIRQDILGSEYSRSDIVNLKIQCNALSIKLEESKEAGSTAVAQILEDISLLKSRVEMLDKWDNETRDKFRSLMDYFEISFTDGRSVVERESED